ncbi:uncharacterized protein C8Q71DRAFT_354245 [Rhodofomes roseus]|uniref:C2H2-type domain-containing protein n=1 Tax=Rhodofomes roseus TaxID=34475 RepID=A0ABQ8KU20_9APHY|nr:uncharacterized protein C8Q71DRAFT_354245 [Rhodofomes roseus]KAH9841921.1 hypothetical protein C8Q71DRAFT_354245 [Rhodofomes roseus]
MDDTNIPRGLHRPMSLCHAADDHLSKHHFDPSPTPVCSLIDSRLSPPTSAAIFPCPATNMEDLRSPHFSQATPQSLRSARYPSMNYRSNTSPRPQNPAQADGWNVLGTVSPRQMLAGAYAYNSGQGLPASNIGSHGVAVQPDGGAAASSAGLYASQSLGRSGYTNVPPPVAAAGHNLLTPSAGHHHPHVNLSTLGVSNGMYPGGRPMAYDSDGYSYQEQNHQAPPSTFATDASFVPNPLAHAHAYSPQFTTHEEHPNGDYASAGVGYHGQRMDGQFTGGAPLDSRRQSGFFGHMLPVNDTVSRRLVPDNGWGIASQLSVATAEGTPIVSRSRNNYPMSAQAAHRPHRAMVGSPQDAIPSIRPSARANSPDDPSIVGIHLGPAFDPWEFVNFPVDGTIDSQGHSLPPGIWNTQNVNDTAADFSHPVNDVHSSEVDTGLGGTIPGAASTITAPASFSITSAVNDTIGIPDVAVANFWQLNYLSHHGGHSHDPITGSDTFTTHTSPTMTRVAHRLQMNPRDPIPDPFALLSRPSLVVAPGSGAPIATSYPSHRPDGEDGERGTQSIADVSFGRPDVVGPSRRYRRHSASSKQRGNPYRVERKRRSKHRQNADAVSPYVFALGCYFRILTLYSAGSDPAESSSTASSAMKGDSGRATYAETGIIGYECRISGTCNHHYGSHTAIEAAQHLSTCIHSFYNSSNEHPNADNQLQCPWIMSDGRRCRAWIKVDSNLKGMVKHGLKAHLRIYETRCSKCKKPFISKDSCERHVRERDCLVS